MTARDILNNMYPPVGVGIRNKNANNDLTTSEVNTLVGIVDSFEKEGASYNWKLGVQTLSGVASRFVKSFDGIVNNQQALPLLIQQVIFYLAVKGEDTSLYNQAEYMYELTGSNEFNPKEKLTCSNPTPLDIGKLLNKMPYEYKYYIKCRDYSFKYPSLSGVVYSQPAILFSYNGQKDKHLGVAIRNLAYQAGKYTKCVDVFGGTGSGILAIPKRGNPRGSKRGVVEYIYNDFSDKLYNLYEVIKSDDYKLLIDEIQKLKSALQGGDNLEGIDFNKEMLEYYNRVTNRSEKARDNQQWEAGEKSTLWFSGAETRVDFTDIVAYIRKSVINFIDTTGDDYVFHYSGVDYTKANLFDKFEKLKTDYDIFMAYIAESDFYNEFGKEFMHFDLKATREMDCNITDEFIPQQVNATQDERTKAKYVQDGVKTVEDAKQYDMQARFYQYYAYFSNINDSGVDTPVRRALAYIFINSLTTMGGVDVSAVNRMVKSNSKANSWRHFLFPTEKNQNNLPEQSEIIEVLHNEFQRIDLRNEDCIELIDSVTQQIVDEKAALSKSSKIKPEALFIVDSPYIATRGYEDAGDFGAKEMRKLITALGVVSKVGNKFIFCCRACATKASKASKLDVKPIDIAIMENVFVNFSQIFGNKPLWVLTIVKDSSKDFFEDCVRNHEETEIMITNYEIQDFEADSRFKTTKGAGYKVYTFTDFSNKLINLYNSMKAGVVQATP